MRRQVGEYFDLYDNDVFNIEAKDGMKYYFYDLTKHGYPKKPDYPLLIFLHGTGNALEGDVCINSSGASMAFCMVNEYTSYFDALIPIGSASVPDNEALDRYDANDVFLFFAMGKRDEFHSFKEEVEPRLPRLQKMKHCFIYTPEWVRNSDDGTPMDERLPRGITGWLSDYFQER